MSYLTKVCIHNIKTTFIDGDRRYSKGDYNKIIPYYSKDIPFGVLNLMSYTENKNKDKHTIDEIKFFLYEILELPKGLNYDLSLINRVDNKRVFRYRW